MSYKYSLLYQSINIKMGCFCLYYDLINQVNLLNRNLFTSIDMELEHFFSFLTYHLIYSLLNLIPANIITIYFDQYSLNPSCKL